MATKRLKACNEMTNHEEPVLEDRISELPDDVIILILCFLPTVAAIRTCLLSKRWRRVWTLVPIIDIDTLKDISYFTECNDRDIGRTNVITFVDKCLSYPSPITKILKFKCLIDLYGNYDHLDGWLTYPNLKNVKELEVAVETFGLYNLPRLILDLEELTCMRLTHVALETQIPARLPSLKELSLKCVRLENQRLNNLLSGCSSLEKLDMNSCFGYSKLEFSSASLKHFVFSAKMESLHPAIKVMANNLQSFKFHGYNNYVHRVDLAHCPVIRSISITNAHVDDEWFENCVPKFTVLESLNLSNCHYLQSLKICNQNLKRFVFDSNPQLDSLEAVIDTPSLESFSYTGVLMFEISVNAPNLVNVDIRITRRKTYGSKWYARLIKFLSEFNPCKSAYLIFPSQRALIVPVKLREMYDPPFSNLKNLKVKIPNLASKEETMFRNSLLWIAPSLEKLTVQHERVKPYYCSWSYVDVLKSQS